MFSWITGPRITNAIEDLQPDHGYESTFIDAPETPAHQFAVKALKRAVFGTPAADDAINAGKRLQKKLSPDLAASKVPVIAAPREDAPPLSPSKLPGGILMTPGTANKGRKSVSFGAHVVDNEGKRINAGRSGIPSDCPGKFPSPWTPGTELKSNADSEQKPRTKLTAALMDARTTTQPRSGHKPKARDDSDITMDLGAPRSDSGKYWKEQYEEYTARSEKEVKKLIAKQQLAKNYAQKKDGEVTELATKLEQERKRFRRREQELEQQNKDYQERLRQTMAEKLSDSIEITALKNRVATLEKSLTATSSELQETKSSSPFEIFEDTSKNAEAVRDEEDRLEDASYLSQKVRVVSIGKENSPPKPRHVRRQDMPEPASVPQVSSSATPRLGVTAGDVSTILGRPPRAAAREAKSTTKPTSTLNVTEPASTPFLSIRKQDVSQQNVQPKSPAPVAPSSPLPQPSPDPWMGADQSSIADYDRMAVPIGGGGGGTYTRPSRPLRSRRHTASKSISRTPVAERSRPSHSTGEGFLLNSKVETQIVKDSSFEKPVPANAKFETTPSSPKAAVEPTATARTVDDVKPSGTSSTDSKFDMSKITSHHAEGSSQVKKERMTLPVDRKAEARKRLAERRQKKQLAK
ncbi:hypothetical protein P171DRAFT_520084 [Karstenula rhodostoma CBS 690.94]|uniref:Spindle pole body-associated protein cut12 domain-containing protein n=1 Tax=Karstenula rhodostoma CBS 690.94 TaxID=1392251 RepID=A0A9P4UDQ9_9PLEO|nr:hypothetical protein P171DRAFT_520084 [Karstenula rhodostoma CBS 690.94]